MRLALIYDLFEDYPWRAGDPPDADAELEPPETLDVLIRAVQTLGAEPIPVGTAHQLLESIKDLNVDAAINIAEGVRGRNREGFVPALLELMEIPFIGSDALTLSLSLDKAWTKDLASVIGVQTPAYSVARPGRNSTLIEPSDYPLFVKPRYEGTAKGILPQSKVDSPAGLMEQIRRTTEVYGQDALIEQFIEGSEFTVGIVGNDPPEALPVLQRATEKATGIGLHALERSGVPQLEWEYELTGRLDEQLERELQIQAIAVFEKLECKDFARVDFRVDLNGQIWFLEINPLPTFAPDGTFAIIAELMGRDYVDVVSELIRRGLRRIGVF